MATSVLKNSRVYLLAFIVYWGILLFGYDTYVPSFTLLNACTRTVVPKPFSGIGGGVVSAPYFLETFGLIVNGDKNQKKIDEVSGNVVAVLQAGAFFGALTSAPVSCESPAPPEVVDPSISRLSLVPPSALLPFYLLNLQYTTVSEPAHFNRH